MDKKSMQLPVELGAFEIENRVYMLPQTQGNMKPESGR